MRGHKKRNRLLTVLLGVGVAVGLLFGGAAAFHGGEGAPDITPQNENWCSHHVHGEDDLVPFQGFVQTNHCDYWWHHRHHDGTTTTTPPTTAAPTVPVVNPLPGGDAPHFMYFCINFQGNRMEPKRAGLSPRLCGHPGRDFHVAVPVSLVP